MKIFARLSSRMFAKIVVPGGNGGTVKIETVVAEVGVIVIVMVIVGTKIVVEVIGIVVEVIVTAVTETEMIGTAVEEGIGIGEADVTIAAAGMIVMVAGVITVTAIGAVRTNTFCRFQSLNSGKIHSHATRHTSLNLARSVFRNSCVVKIR